MLLGKKKVLSFSKLQEKEVKTKLQRQDTPLLRRGIIWTPEAGICGSRLIPAPVTPHSLWRAMYFPEVLPDSYEGSN